MIKNLAIGNRANRLQLLLGLVLAAVAAVLIAVFLSQARSETATPSGQTPVVVASSDIPANTRVTVGMLQLKSLPASAVLPTVFTRTEDVVGQVTQVPIAAGEQVLPTKVTATGAALTEFGDSAPLSLIVPQGRRAFAVHVSPVSAAGGLVRPGDYVDVILSGAAAGVENGQSFLTSGSACFVAQDLQVLAVDDSLENVTAGGGAEVVAASSAKTDALSATLAATPDESWWLAAAQQSVDGESVGVQLWLALRPFGEHGAIDSLPNCGVIPGA